MNRKADTMVTIRIFLITALTLPVWGQSNANKPSIGYVYPAGGQRGSAFLVTAGGQSLSGATDVYVSGEGVRASIVQYMKPLNNLDREQRKLLQVRMLATRNKRLDELFGDSPQNTAAEDASDLDGVTLPDYPLFYDLENKSLRELAHVVASLTSLRKKRQLNRQLAAFLLMKITIDADAEPGARMLRVATRNGLTNPVIFRVGSLPEVRELEPNDREASPSISALLKLKPGDFPELPGVPLLDLPVIVNGQIMPGDVDRFRFRAEQGQKLVIEAHARCQIPYLADAVPGWFQATLTLYDAGGDEVAFDDDYRLQPDPVILYRVPRDGEYELEIHDAIYRGREDFVYRISVGEQAFVTQMFPLGGKEGEAVTIDGWNLPTTTLRLNAEAGAATHGSLTQQKEDWLAHPLFFEADDLPERQDSEPNDTIADAEPVKLPVAINGRIDKPGDVDVFELKGSAGDKLVVEVYARRLNSPVDSIVRLTDASGNVLAWNDDFVIEDGHLYIDESGWLTHHADSYLLAELPADGSYYVHLSDAQHGGGDAYAYRLHIAPPRPDFTLLATPSGVSLRPGMSTALSVYVLRKNGFDGEIEVALKDAPAGFVLTGGRVPAGSNHVRMTLKGPSLAPGQAVSLRMEGHAQVGERTLIRPVIPAENEMQAFLYRHLVPSQELLVVSKKARGRIPSIELEADGPIRIRAGGTAQVTFKTTIPPSRLKLAQIQLELNDAPQGVSLQDMTFVRSDVTFQLKIEEGTLPVGFTGNLIAEIYREITPRGKDGKAAQRKRRVSLGVLPAIPIVVTE